MAGGGAFAVLPLLSPFENLSPLPTPKLPDIIPLARGHSAPVLDTAWSPHSNSLLASAGDDGKILLWNFDNELSSAAHGSEQYGGKFAGWGEDDWTCPEDWEYTSAIPKAGGGRKVGQIAFNPLAQGILAGAAGDLAIRVWDTDSGKYDEPIYTLKGHKDSIQSMAWNYTGSLLVTTCRDKKIRLFDPRAGSEAVKTTDGHGGIKGSRVVWLGDRDRIVTTGFSRMSDRQMMLWDTGAGDLNCIKTETIDSSSGVVMPHYIEGNSVLLLAGKGDGNIRFFEYADDDLFYLSEHKSSDPQRGFTLLPRHAVDVAQNEVARGFKLTTSTVEPIGFVIPRKADNFQADIFPPAPSQEPTFSSAEWQDGKTGPPKVVDLESKTSTEYQGPPPSSSAVATPVKADKPVKTEKQSSSPSPTTPNTAQPSSLTTNNNDNKPFNPQNLEIEQDDPDSDEELTEAKKRAPPTDDGEDGFEDKAVAPQAVTEQRKSDDDAATDSKAKDQVDKEAEQQQPVSNTETSTSSSAAAAGATVTQTSDQADHGKCQSDLDDLRNKFEALEKENKLLKDQLSRAKKAAQELVGSL